MAILKVDNIQSTSDGSVTFPQGTLSSSGTASAPSLSFTGNTNTGIYRIADSAIGISTGGTLRTRIDNNGLEIVDGSASTPSISFLNDTDTGFYRIGNNTIGIASNGSRVGEIGNGYGGFTGNIIQYVSATSNSTSLTTNNIPIDNTIPQITEGAEFITLSITPRYSTSRLFITASGIVCGSDANQWTTLALFQDSNVNALAVAVGSIHGINYGQLITLNHSMISNTTSATTFRIRHGNNSGTSYINRNSGLSPFYSTAQTFYFGILEAQQ